MNWNSKETTEFNVYSRFKEAFIKTEIALLLKWHLRIFVLEYVYETVTNIFYGILICFLKWE